MLALPLRFQYDDYLSWLKYIVKSKDCRSDVEIEKRILRDKMGQKYGVMVADVIDDIRVIEREVKNRVPVSNYGTGDEANQKPFISLTKPVPPEDQLATDKRLQNSEYFEFLLSWNKQREHITDELLKKWVSSHRLNKRFGVNVNNVIIDMNYLFLKEQKESPQNFSKKKKKIGRCNNKATESDGRFYDHVYILLINEFAKSPMIYTDDEMYCEIIARGLDKRYQLSSNMVRADIESCRERYYHSDKSRKDFPQNTKKNDAEKDASVNTTNSSSIHFSVVPAPRTHQTRPLKNYFGTVWVSSHVRVRNGKLEYVRGHFRNQ